MCGKELYESRHCMDLSQPVSHRVPACLEKMPGKQQGDTKHRTISPKSGPFQGVFWMAQNAFPRQKRIFLKTKKADQKHCENWRRESGSEFHKTSPTCERGEGRKQLQDFITQSLKQTPHGSGTISSLFCSNGYIYKYMYQNAPSTCVCVCHTKTHCTSLKHTRTRLKHTDHHTTPEALKLARKMAEMDFSDG